MISKNGSKPHPIHLLELPQGEARELLRSGVPVFLLVNPVEYHGPHLSVRNDGILSLGISGDVHRHLSSKVPEHPFVVAGVIDAGVDTTPGAGSQPMTMAVVGSLVEGACAALADLGARAVVIMTFHGAARHNLAIQRGVELLEARGVPVVAPFNEVLRGLVHFDPDLVAAGYEPIENAAERAAVLRDAAVDIHAGYLETSLSLHYAPETVGDHRSLPPCPKLVPDRRLMQVALGLTTAGRREAAAEVRLLAYTLGWGRLDPFPGYTGSPHLASAEAGASFANTISSMLAPLVTDVLAGRSRSPEPVMAWQGPLTLGGRVNDLLPVLLGRH